VSALLPDSPPPRRVVSQDNVQIASYEFGDPDKPTVVAVHGFASSALANWHATGWTRDLMRSGFHVIALDQRGHGLSDKPHDPAAYSMELLVIDLLAVMDAYMIDDALYAGYSLGARVGWQTALDLEERISRAVLGGIPDGQPLTRIVTEQARAHARSGSVIEDPVTRTYGNMAENVGDNDIEALMALVDGMRDGIQPDPGVPPQQEILFATGSDDAILDRSKRLAAATPRGTFYEIPGRNHFNAPTSRQFRDAAVSFFTTRS
jgi:pimeloyl-ACP methyl ester carboxylesterase